MIRVIGFGGESRTGSLVTQHGADSLKRLHLERGGKHRVIVFDDADPERALDAVIVMVFSITGEGSTSSSRLPVQDPIRSKALPGWPAVWHSTAKASRPVRSSCRALPADRRPAR